MWVQISHSKFQINQRRKFFAQKNRGAKSPRPPLYSDPWSYGRFSGQQRVHAFATPKEAPLLHTLALGLDGK